MFKRLKTSWRGLLGPAPALGAALALGIATLLVYLPVRHYEFVDWDDGDYVYSNDYVRGGFTQYGITRAFTHSHSGNWHPLTWMSHMLDCQLFGLNAGAHHLVNLGFHVANVLLLFAFLRTLTRKVWGAAFATGLFALHPIHVESVAWVSERKDVLSTFFFLLTLLAYLRYAGRSRVSSLESQVSSLKSEGQEGSRTPRAALWYVLSLLLFTLGLMSKPMVVTLPCVLLLLDYWPLHRFAVPTGKAPAKTVAWLLVEKGPFFGLAAASCVVTFLVQNQVGTVMALGSLPLGARVENAVVAYAQYLLMFVWPTNLSPIYLRPPSWEWWRVVGGVVLLVALTGIGWAWRRRRPGLLIGWLWYLGTLVPVLGLVQVGYQAFADRYTYIPLLGVLLAVACLAEEGLARWTVPGTEPPGVLGASRLRGWPLGLLAGLLALGVIGAFTWATAKQVKVWQNTETLFRRALAVSPTSMQAVRGLAPYLVQSGRGEEGLALLEAALRRIPDEPELLGTMADLQEQLGHHAKAFEYYQAALKAYPDYPRVLNNLAWLQATCEDPGVQDGAAAVQLATRACELTHYTKPLTLRTLAAAQATAGDLPAAIATADRAVALAAELGISELATSLRTVAGELRFRRGVQLQLQGKGTEALPYLEQALVAPALQPERDYRLGLSLLAAGRVAEAETALRCALKAAPQSMEYQLGMAALWQAQGQTNLADQAFRKVLAEHPEVPRAQRLYAHSLELLGRLPEAAEHYAKALDLEPTNTVARHSYAMVLAKAGQATPALQELELAAQAAPQDASIRYDLASLLSDQGKAQEALTQYNRVLQAAPRHVAALNDLAWLLATAADDHLRDGPRAVELAERACQLTEWKAPLLMGTLAAAYAEAGRFTNAVAMAEKARDQARQDHLEAVANRNEELLQLYRAHKPYHEGEK